MEKIDKFELMLMDSPINILELPDGVCASILELMNKCYTTSNEEVVKIINERLSFLKLCRPKPLERIKELDNLLKILKGE